MVVKRKDAVRQERIEGELVSTEVISQAVKRANANKARAQTNKQQKRTASNRLTHSVEGNEDVHRDNESDRQLDARHDIERDSEMPSSWRQPNVLDAPPPRPGFVNRWVAWREGNAEDAEHVEEMLEEGWRPVPRSRVRKEHELTASPNSKRGRYYVKRGLILMELPEKLYIQRKRFYDSQTKNLTRGIDRTMFRLNNRYMPLMQPSRSTRVSTRARRGSLEGSVPADEPEGAEA